MSRVQCLVFKPSRCIKASFRIYAEWPNFWLNFLFQNENFHGTVLILTIFPFITHVKSSSFTASRELRQQFASCSGWRWHWYFKCRLGSVKRCHTTTYVMRETYTLCFLNWVSTHKKTWKIQNCVCTYRSRVWVAYWPLYDLYMTCQC